MKDEQQSDRPSGKDETANETRTSQSDRVHQPYQWHHDDEDVPNQYKKHSRSGRPGIL